MKPDYVTRAAWAAIGAAEARHTLRKRLDRLADTLDATDVWVRNGYHVAARLLRETLK